MLLPLITLITLLPVLSTLAVSPTTPSGNYTPSFVQCPANHTFVRPASDGVSLGEAEWLKARRKATVPALTSYLLRHVIAGFDHMTYVKALEKDDTKAPTLALSFSGGGTRAELSDLGLYRAIDGRVDESVAAGTGGLLQAMTYVAGREYCSSCLSLVWSDNCAPPAVSGGSLASGGLGITGFPTVTELIETGRLNVSHNTAALAGLAGKREMGYPLT